MFPAGGADALPQWHRPFAAGLEAGPEAGRKRYERYGPDGPLSEQQAACPQCLKVYRRRKHMLCHLRLECGKEPQFRCMYCGHATKQKSNLNTHMKKHHPEHYHLQ